MVYTVHTSFVKFILVPFIVCIALSTLVREWINRKPCNKHLKFVSSNISTVPRGRGKPLIGFYYACIQTRYECLLSANLLTLEGRDMSIDALLTNM